MSNGINIAKNIWRSHSQYLGEQSVFLEDNLVEKMIADIFCPGPYFYYVIDSPTLTFDLISNEVSQVLGIPAERTDLRRLIATLHPDDLDFFLRCEDVVAYFLKNQISPDKMCSYKIVSCLRHLLPDGSTVTLLKQTIVLKATETGSLLKVLGIHADITHITKNPTKTLSFFGLGSEPSFMEIDVFQEGIFKSFSPYQYQLDEISFTKRELEIIRLLARGNSTAQVASSLNISSQTVQTHRKNILKKAPVRNTTELIEYCIRNCYL